MTYDAGSIHMTDEVACVCMRTTASKQAGGTRSTRGRRRNIAAVRPISFYFFSRCWDDNLNVGACDLAHICGGFHDFAVTANHGTLTASPHCAP